MRLKCGDYVRTDNGEMHKVIDIEKGSIKIKSQYKEWIGLCCIVNHSKQPIELIEDKDIVEIELSEEFVERKDKKKLIQIGDIYTKETLQKDIDNGIITRILTILSYNQYMANCYKVGGENE